jgi:hypothetical protein
VVDTVVLEQFVSERLFSLSNYLSLVLRIQLSSVTGTVGPLEASNQGDACVCLSRRKIAGMLTSQDNLMKSFSYQDTRERRED